MNGATLLLETVRLNVQMYQLLEHRDIMEIPQQVNISVWLFALKLLSSLAKTIQTFVPTNVQYPLMEIKQEIDHVSLNAHYLAVYTTLPKMIPEFVCKSARRIHGDLNLQGNVLRMLLIVVVYGLITPLIFVLLYARNLMEHLVIPSQGYVSLHVLMDHMLMS